MLGGIIMAWEKDLLKEIIIKLVEEDRKSYKIHSKLTDLGVELKFMDAIYTILEDVGPEELDFSCYLSDSEITEEECADIFLYYLEKEKSKQ